MLGINDDIADVAEANARMKLLKERQLEEQERRRQEEIKRKTYKP